MARWWARHLVAKGTCPQCRFQAHVHYLHFRLLQAPRRAQSATGKHACTVSYAAICKFLAVQLRVPYNLNRM